MPILPSGGRVQPCMIRNESSKPQTTKCQSIGQTIETDQVDGGNSTEGASDLTNIIKNDDNNENDNNVKRATNDSTMKDDEKIKIENIEHRNVKNVQKMNRSETNSIGSSTSLNNIVSHDPEPNTSNSNSVTNLDDTKSTTSSAQYSMGSDSNEPKRTLLNKYVKKVKSLIKK